MTIDTDGLMKLLEGVSLRLPLRYDESTRNVYTAEEEYDGEQYHSWLAECGSPSFGRLSVAAVNALPELLAENERLNAERDALKALCHEASEHYGYGGTFPIRGLMAMRLIGAALGNLEPARAALTGETP